MLTEYLVENQMKKLVTDKPESKKGWRQQILWFVGIYLASLLVALVFHEFSNLLIKILK